VVEKVDQLAEETGTDRSAALRALLVAGLRNDSVVRYARELLETITLPNS
jgi:hypothetical protein